MRKIISVFAVALGIMVSTAAFAADALDTKNVQAPISAAFSEAQRAEIEGIIKEYLTNKHPEVVAEGLQTLQNREQSAEENKIKGKVAEFKKQLFDDPATPIGGNPKGDVTVVEFFDYQCGYCKMAEDSIERVMKEDKKVKVVYKAFPILGDTSVDASKAALASIKQNKFSVFHTALMNKKERLSKEIIFQIAKSLGIDVDRLKKDMEDKSVTDAIAANLELGRNVGVRGTPMFIIDDHVFPGAMQYEQMKEAIDKARAAKKS